MNMSKELTGGEIVITSASDISDAEIARQLAIVNDPKRMEKIAAHVTEGGSLIDLCRVQRLRYHEVIKWINQDEGRKKEYSLAKAAREEWLFERVLELFKNISESDVSEIMNPDGSYKPVSEWPKWASVTVKSLDVYEEKVEGAVVGEVKRVTFWDKNKTLESIGKHVKMFAEKQSEGTDSWADLVERSFSEGESGD